LVVDEAKKWKEQKFNVFLQKYHFSSLTPLENEIIVSDADIKMKLERTKIKSYKKFKRCGEKVRIEKVRIEKVRTCFPSYLKVAKFEIQKPNH